MKIIRFSLLGLFCIIYSCINEKSNTIIQDIDITTAINYVLDNTFTKEKFGQFKLSPTFCSDMPDSSLIFDISSVDSIFSEKDLSFMVSQYQNLKAKSNKLYVDMKYHTKFSEEYNSKDSCFYFEISPPMFTLEKKYFVIYINAFFEGKNGSTWDELFYVYRKDESWKLVGLIESSR